MAQRNLIHMRRAIFLALTLSPLVCEGFGFTFTAYPSAQSRSCAIMQCTEKVQGKQPVSSDHSRRLAGLTIYKLSPGHGTQGGHWEQIATVTPQFPSEKRTAEGLDISGHLTDTEASLTLEMSKPEDCTSAEFSCAAVLVDSDSGQTTRIKSFIKSTSSSVSNDVPRADNPHLSPFVDSLSVSDGQTGRDERLMVSIFEKLKCMEKRMDDYLREGERLNDKVDKINDKLLASEIRVGDRLDRLENRLEDKLSGLTRYSEPREITRDVCSSNFSTQLSAVVKSVGTIEKNLTSIGDQVLRTEEAATLSASAVTALGGELENLTSDISSVSRHAGDLVTRLDAFRKSYSGGALVPVDEFFDALGTGKKEWRLAFRGTAYNNVDVYPAYLYGTDIPPDVEAGCKQFDQNLPCVHHYRNRDALESWANIDEVLFAIYAKGQMVKRVVFNARGSDFMNWFEANRVIDSSWTDLKTLSHNFFSVTGTKDPNCVRRFYINHKYNSCPGDEGWFAAVEMPNGICPWEQGVAFPLFLYASGSTVSRWASPGVSHADAVGVFLKYQ